MQRRRDDGRPGETLDAAFGGRLLLRQPRTGYRFNADAPLLVWFCCTRDATPARRAADLGAGCGVVALGLLAAGRARRAVAVEVQERLAELCAENAAANGLAARIDVVRADMRTAGDALERGRFDLVAVNPPYWRGGGGHLPIDAERRAACHELLIDLDGWVGVAAGLLSPRRGRLCAVFPARRLTELTEALARHSLGGAALRFVHPRPDADAELVLVEARPGRSRPVAIEPPLVLRGADNADTEAALGIYGGRFSSELAALPDRRPAPVS